MSADELETFGVHVKAETGKALLVTLVGPRKDQTVWIPKSVIDFYESEVEKRGDIGTLAVQRWWVEKEGIG